MICITLAKKFLDLWDTDGPGDFFPIAILIDL